MWNLLSYFLLLSLGMGMGVVLMCLLQVAKEADKRMEKLERSNEE